MKLSRMWIGAIVVAGLQIVACGSGPAPVVCGHDCSGRPIYTDDIPGTVADCSPTCVTSCIGAKPTCTSSCGLPSASSVEPVCSGGQWTCPTPPVAAGMCPFRPCTGKKPYCVANCDTYGWVEPVCTEGQWTCATPAVAALTCPRAPCVGSAPGGGDCGMDCDLTSFASVCINRNWVCARPTRLECPSTCTRTAQNDCVYWCGGDYVVGAPRADCVSWCGGDYFVAETCQNGAWACPAGTKKQSECPLSTCSGASPPCYGCQDHQVKVIGYARCVNGQHVCDRGSQTPNISCNTSNVDAG